MKFLVLLIKLGLIKTTLLLMSLKFSTAVNRQHYTELCRSLVQRLLAIGVDIVD